MTDLDKALWRAVVTEDVAGLALAAANGANTESQVSDLALNSAFTARRVFSETEQNKTTEEQAQA